MPDWLIPLAILATAFVTGSLGWLAGFHAGESEAAAREMHDTPEPPPVEQTPAPPRRGPFR